MARRGAGARSGACPRGAKAIELGRKGRICIKPGALHRALGIPQGQTIPKTLLERIKAAKVGSVITNPTRTGKRRIKVTAKLKRRAVLAWTMRFRWRRRRR